MRRPVDKSPLAEIEAVAWALVLAGLVLGGGAVLVALRAAGWGRCR